MQANQMAKELQELSILVRLSTDYLELAGKSLDQCLYRLPDLEVFLERTKVEMSKCTVPSVYKRFSDFYNVVEDFVSALQHANH